MSYSRCQVVTILLLSWCHYMVVIGGDATQSGGDVSGVNSDGGVGGDEGGIIGSTASTIPAISSEPSGVSGPDYTGPSAGSDECDPEMVGFELITGYVYTAPANTLETIPGMLMLTDCLETCQANDSCQAVNYETGLCVLFSSNADDNPGMKNIFIFYSQSNLIFIK